MVSKIFLWVNIRLMREILDRFTIDRRFCGPDDSGNGGYVCGKLGQYLEGAVEVRLKLPPPLETPLEVIRSAENLIELFHGEELIAEAKTTTLDLTVPSAPTWEEATAASRHYLGFQDHKYPHCFVCGPQRQPGDGLCIYPGKVPGKNLVAAPWIPDPSLGETGLVRPEIIWASLDCPGAFGFLKEEFTLILLGTLTVEIKRRVQVGERLVVIGWRIAQEGRKNFVGSALFNGAGELCAQGKGVWIELKGP